MPRGKTTIRFIGGIFDGDIDEVATIYLAQFMEVRLEHWTRVLDDGSAQIVKGSKLDSRWDNYSVDVYEKQLERDNNNFFIYKYVKTKDVFRCLAKTKKGTRCLNTAKPDEDNCPRHTGK